MIRQTRRKIIIVTMAILVTVFVIVGAFAFVIMDNKPQKYPFDEPLHGGIARPADSEFDDAIKAVEAQLAREWLLWYSLAAGTVLAGLFVITYFLSGWIVRPIKEAMEKQKQFASDASHELKTPISIISANADVLTATGTENKWLASIKTQAERMRLLTNDLLALTKIEEDSHVIYEKINLSEAVTEAALPFESVAFEAGKKLEICIGETLYYTGAREDIIKAVDILVDNAIKYSDERGTVKIKLTKQGAKNVLEVFNTGGGISESEKTKIFDRFYRSDYSRTRENGGSGLGLSILKNLAGKRGWKLVVDSDGKSYVAFVISF